MTNGKRKRIALWIVAWSLFATSLIPNIWFGASLLYVSTDNETDHAVPSDVIIVFGCPSYEGNIPAPTFSACIQARAHHAAELYLRGMSQHIIPTGGMTGPPPTEAAAMSAIMQQDGVPQSAIFLEEQARSTVDNVRYSRLIMQSHNWTTAILVSEPNHIKRAALIARDGGITGVTSPAVNSAGWNTPSERDKNLWRDARTLMTYQFNKLMGANP